MLEKLEFGIGGFVTGHKHIRIWTEDGKAYKYYKGDFFDPDSEYTEEISSEEFNTLEHRLSELQITEWENKYVNRDVFDGTQWNLEYKESGQDDKNIYGSNDYPEMWKEFIEAIGALIPEILPEIYFL